MSEKQDIYRPIEETDMAKTIVKNDMDAIIAEMNKLDGNWATIGVCEEFILALNRGDYHLVFNTEAEPFAFIGDAGMIISGFYINPTYYKNNRKSSDEEIIRLINAYTGESIRFSIDDDGLTPKIVDALVQNVNIKEIILRDIPLTPKLYEGLRTKPEVAISSNNIDEQLLEIFDGSIKENMQRTLVQSGAHYTYEWLTNTETLRFDKPVPEKELVYIEKYAKQVKEVNFDKDSFSSIREVISALNNNDIEYTIKLGENTNYDLDSFRKLQNSASNIKVDYRSYTVPLEQYINTMQQLEELVAPIKGLDLSPLEKYLFAFKTTAQFRKYQENDADRSNARNLFALFAEGNTDIVCVGFANILTEVCKYLDIECNNISLFVDVSHDRPDEEILAEQQKMRDALGELAVHYKNDGFNDEDEADAHILATEELIDRITSETPLTKGKCNDLINALSGQGLTKEEIPEKIEAIIKSLEVLSEGHQRNLIHIKDEKYGIDGIYIADATWCNYLDHDVYVNALMTPQETLHNKRALRSDNQDLLTVQTYEEFIEMIYLDFRKDKHFKFNHTLSTIESIYPDFSDLLQQHPAYTKFKQKVGGDMEDYRNLFSDDSFMQAVFGYIQKRCNNVIDGQTIIDAAMNLNTAMNPNQNMDEIKETRYKLVKDNRHIYDRQFPPIIVEGTKATFVRANEVNKFDLTTGYFVDSENKLWLSKEAYLESLEEKKEETPQPPIQPNPLHLDPDYYTNIQPDEEIESARRL